ncbi:hypothetical protein Pcinc_008182 [Petrolisthes cinctipes]|uniref:Trans-1,2-dihydrobenzene-1,2-diol dehydrogenase n=1 Tax=Petrolisthes cinctipes TaxID=88211 RepID=A0AAE1FL09_PETCI|nr:hypothetical protein Pcinc_019558 [Petrolisthes cinctipes]KAK3887730.1 hypothetical protein Pcinc_008182 [Petrolisthes cinctipes]
MATRWGIVSAGKISSDFVASLKALPESEHKVVAVAARSLQNAQEFAKKYGIEKAYGSYDDLGNDPNVDVVYIGTVQSHHLSVSVALMRAGKHILCEKPLCINVKEVKEMIKVAKEQKVFMMEAVWSRFFPAYKELEKRLKAGEIGQVRHVIASFGKDLRHFQRLQNIADGGGATLDVGIYSIQLVSLVMGGDKPLKIVGTGHQTSAGTGVEESIGSTLLYSDGRIASISASFVADLPSEAFIIGSKGTIKIPYPMWCPETIEGPSGTMTVPLPKTAYEFNYDNSQGLMYEAMEVRRCLQQGLLESPGMPHSESLTVAEIMQAVRMQAGTVYPQD